MAENVMLAKAWVGVVEDPYIGANQHIDKMWLFISQGYLKFKLPSGKPRSPEQCRKQWERLRGKISRYAGIYQNNLHQATSGMSTDDVKNLSMQQYPDKELKFREFEHWEVYLVVQDFPKFCAGVEAGWPKRMKINASGEYSSSAGSHELLEAEANNLDPSIVFPSLLPSGRAKVCAADGRGKRKRVPRGPIGGHSRDQQSCPRTSNA